MLDRVARRAVTPALEPVAAVLVRLRVPATVLTGVGWLVGVGACLAVVAGAWSLALALWLGNRLLDGLDGAVARRTRPTELGGFLDVLADFSVYAGFVLAVAVRVPDARLACVALLVAYYLSGTAFLALSSVLERSGAQHAGRWADGRSLRFVGGLAEGTETVVVYVVVCLFPAAAEQVAWVFAGVVAVTALQRLLAGTLLLGGRAVPSAGAPTVPGAARGRRSPEET